MSASHRMSLRIVSGGLAAFIFVFVFEFFVHGFLMMGMYEATMAAWRPQAESNMAVMMLSQFLFAMAVAFFYPIIGPDPQCKRAIPFAIGLGLVMAMPQIASYSYLPIPISISLAWAMASFFKSFGSVLIVSKVFNKLNQHKAAQ